MASMPTRGATAADQAARLHVFERETPGPFVPMSPSDRTFEVPDGLPVRIARSSIESCRHTPLS